MKVQPDQRELLKSKADNLTETEVVEVLEYIAIMQTMNRQTGETELFHRALAGVFFRARHQKRNRALRH